MRILTVILAVLGLSAPAFSQTYTISPSPFLIAQNNSGAIINAACIWTYTAGTTTAATTYSDNAGTPNLNPIRSDSAGRFTAFLVPGSSYKFVYESTCVPPAHATVLRTADNIAATPASAANADVPGVAGEALSVGQIVYLSDGSGSKNAGQWYKADSANAYSSLTPELGMPTAAIASGATGTIRIAGQVTGLTVNAGSTYYVGTAGAITSTAPPQARAIGVADAATTLILTPNPGVPLQAWVDDFRLTLTTGVPLTIADVTAATTIFCTPYVGTRLDLPDSSGNPVRVTSAQFSIAVPATTSTMYDIFAYNNAGVATLELLAWTNTTTRATAIVQTTNGRWHKTGDFTRQYMGSFMTTTVSGQTEDSFAKGYLFNMYNRVVRLGRVTDTADSWAYSLAAFQQAHATATNQLDFVVGVADTPLHVEVVGLFANSGGAANQNGAVAIGEDGITRHANNVGGFVVAWLNSGNLQGTGLATLDIYPAVGRHFYTWLESNATGSGTGTWFGDNGATLVQSGITGRWVH